MIGSQIWRSFTGQVNTIKAAVLATLAATNGASLIGFLQSGAGAQAATLQDKGRERPTPLDYMTAAMRADAMSGAPAMDHTAAIQAALSANTQLFPARGATYIINSTLTVPAGCVADFTGSTVKAGAAKAGLLNTNGVHFDLQAGAKLLGVTIVPSASAFTLGGAGWESAVQIKNAARSVVRDCVITLTGTNIDDAITVTGTSDYCDIERNTVTGAGIRYTDAGARFTRAVGNTIVDSPVNAMSGTGNAAREGYGCVVEGNRIVNPARMGIEDFAQTSLGFYLRGTRIASNTIVGGAAAQYFAISCAAYECHVIDNQILNWPKDYAVEIHAEMGHVVRGNLITWTDGNPNAVEAIQTNPTADVSLRIAANLIEGNNIQGAALAIRLFAPGKTIVRGNSFTGCVRALLCDALGTEVVFAGNLIKVTTQTTVGRTQVFVWGNCVVEGNHITYEASFNGGPAGLDVAFGVAGPNTIVQGNVVNSGGYSTAGAAPLGMYSNGATPAGVRVLHNQFVGGTRANYQNFVDLVAENNVVSGAITGVTNAKRAFYDGQAPITRPAVVGSRAANAALQSLITQLANTGLISDTTTA